MRIVAGSRGGRRISAPAGSATRPTSDRVREALFSVLGDIGGLRVLDLFAGSGALGLEALSRGAAEATFVDSAQPAVKVLRANLAALDLEAEVRKQDARAFLKNAKADHRAYDLVFVDPPYRLAARLGAELSPLITAVLQAGARVVGESDRRAPLALELPVKDERRYGDTLIRIHESE
jgi:16S rRNA (guanine966-N2)-methyltransferase